MEITWVVVVVVMLTAVLLALVVVMVDIIVVLVDLVVSADGSGVVVRATTVAVTLVTVNDAATVTPAAWSSATSLEVKLSSGISVSTLIERCTCDCGAKIVYSTLTDAKCLA